MFEGKPPLPGNARPLPQEWEGEALRELTWADLVARLSASRGVRGTVEPADEGGEASFDALSARRLAAHHNGKWPVNPDDLADGKAPQRTAAQISGDGSEFAPDARK